MGNKYLKYTIFTYIYVVQCTLHNVQLTFVTDRLVRAFFIRSLARQILHIFIDKYCNSLSEDQRLSEQSSFLRVWPIPSHNLSGQLLKLEEDWCTVHCVYTYQVVLNHRSQWSCSHPGCLALRVTSASPQNRRFAPLGLYWIPTYCLVSTGESSGSVQPLAQFELTPRTEEACF